MSRAPGARACGLALGALGLLALAQCGGSGDGTDDGSGSAEGAADERVGRRTFQPQIGPGPDGPLLQPPTARMGEHLGMKQDLAAARHPADGGGRAWLEVPAGETAHAVAGRAGSWTIVYEAGPLGVAVGGAVYLQVPPFWNWSPPQTLEPNAPGYTVVETDAAGVELEPDLPAETLLPVAIAGRPLREGEQVRFHYGAGPLKARADRYAERRSRFWVAVDGDGDELRALVPTEAALDVLPGPPDRLLITLPTTARPGDEVPVTVAVLDGRGNMAPEFEGTVEFVTVSPGLELPERVELRPEHGARRTITARAADAGLYAIEGVMKHAGVQQLSARATSNPMLVEAGLHAILWADLHGHSNLSDGTGTPDDYYVYAREVAALDVAALTDHDHWGIQFLDAHPALWDEIRMAAQKHHEPGTFVTLLGYEWTSWMHGHRHVLYFDDEGAGEVLSSMDPATETPAQLWDALRGKPALTFAHHSAGGPIATNWSFPPDPELEPVTEIVSVHGQSEAIDAPGRLPAAVSGNFVRDVLDAGYQLGFIGSGDSHDGHPGLAHLAAASGGLAAIFAEERTREGVRQALKARRCYATNGARILLQTSLDGHRMGSTIPASELGGKATLTLRAIGTTPIRRLDLVHAGKLYSEEYEGGGGYGEEQEGGVTVLQTALELELSPGDYVYVRVQQKDRGMAWSSPFFIE